MDNHLNAVLRYFAYFRYRPSFEELYMFFPVKITKKRLMEVCQLFDKRHSGKRSASRIRSWSRHAPQDDAQYTLPQYSTHFVGNPKSKFKIKENKAAGTIQLYLYVLQSLPLVRFVGITGASAMTGIKPTDDIDLCIVTKRGLLWTTRFVVVVLAKILHIHHATGVCLNLFFDESDLTIAKQKQNAYIAHELLQMRSIIDKNGIYGRFLTQSTWIYKYFPNARSVIPYRDTGSRTWIPDSCLPAGRFIGMTQKIDTIFKWAQLPIIMSNKTGLYISPTQLWLFKNDFEKKLKRKGLVE